MANLPTNHGSRDTWGGELNAYLQVGHRADGSHRFGVLVTEYGADNTGATDAATAINAAIASSAPNSAIIFPGGTYRIETPVLLKTNRAYLGIGDVWLKQKPSTPLECLIKVDPGEAYPRRNIFWQSIKLNGDAMDPNTGAETNNTLYTEANALTTNVGMKLDSVQFSNFIDLHIVGCGNTGLELRGTDDPGLDFNKTTSTNHFVSAYIYGNGKYGVLFGERTDDNHVLDSDIGANNYENIYVTAGSNSVRGTTVWGSKRANGILLGGPSNQVIGCQIEGNAQHGVKITDFGSYNLISSSKIYYNSTQTPGAYDGVNIGGTDPQQLDGEGVAHPPRYAMISGNFVYAGIGDFFLTDGEVDPSLWIGHRHAIALETYHDHCTITGNSVDLNAPGAGYGTTYPDSYDVLGVYGLKAGDEYNGTRWTTAAEDTARAVTNNPRTVVPGAPWFRPDTGTLHVHTGPSRDRTERLLTTGYDTVSGSFWSTTATQAVTFTPTQFDTNFTVIVSPSWNTTWWVTDKATGGFTINFGTTGNGHVDWHLLRQGT